MFGRAPRVLVVDDCADSRELLNEYLTHAGFRVLEAADGQSAVDRAVSDQPDIILMDVAMPVMDGYLATRFIKGDLRTRKIPVVISTAGGPDCEHEATSAGCDAFVVKPCLPSDVERVLTRCLVPTVLAGARRG